ncbi:Peptidase S53, propeptide [Akanthomyces lecanii RCEF 1005]|uniref:Peptidase S53, propeptide n=1 Tax=Akanthomyces lecanii RCEF 1005 TaxID=1081108 RepID=A0A162JP84_CORDF|nr:Peptidase S53, propeptide [Akanthomyces lecanii RCEF 1005]
MKLTSSVVAIVLLFCVKTTQSFSVTDYVVHEKQSAGAFGWNHVGTPAAKDTINLRIALTHNNIYKAERLLNQVSHPRSGQYGQYLSPEEVVDLFAPHPDTIKKTMDCFLKSGISMRSIRPSAGRNWIKVNATIDQAERLLRTEYNFYNQEVKNTQAVGCDQYHLPQQLQQHIQLITPTPQLDAVPHLLDQNEELDEYFERDHVFVVSLLVSSAWPVHRLIA